VPIPPKRVPNVPARKGVSFGLEINLAAFTIGNFNLGIIDIVGSKPVLTLIFLGRRLIVGRTTTMIHLAKLSL
jgi:hypothetical protein